ncbi:uncharacterized protein LOC113311689 [Papaver somniferum]|uniref:uncharacterized protein LOC113311689 n=1 Tax=Papaver somniferum TaxID=3469 RepID=UPI000E6FB89E|nr:uncharacterized protein LOC113311689 [Papaver somniferum]
MVNIEMLRDEGVPRSNISKFLINHPRALTIATSKFEENVQRIKGMGFDPSVTTFLLGLNGLAAMNKSTWETKLNAYKKWGCSEEEIQNAFKKQPRFMLASVKKIMSMMDYIVNQMGCNPSLIAKCPVILCFSLEKRIIPRCVVIQLLVSQGQVKEHYLSTVSTISEKSFLEKYVGKYEAEVPGLLKVYHNSQSTTS